MSAPAYPIPPDAVTPCATKPDWFFPAKGNAGPTIEAARNLCAACPYRAGCADWAVRRGELGIWAGTTEDDRKAIRKARRIVPVPVEMPRLIEPKRTRGEVQCGSWAAIKRHRANGEKVCFTCRDFSNEARRRARAAQSDRPFGGDPCAKVACTDCGREMLPKSLPRHRRNAHGAMAS